MAVVRTVVHETIAPGVGLALDRLLLRRAHVDGSPRLHVFAWPGDVLAVGRYHRIPDGADAAVHRRLSGGRTVVGGDGFVGVSLALPHRSALESAEPYALRAEQTMNRAVRGILGGLELLGVDAHYPGRDLVTAGGKPIGWLSLAVEDDGAALFEAGVSLGRDLAVLSGLADRVDPTGVVPTTMWLPDDVTSVARVRGGVPPSFAEAASALLEGFQRRLGVRVVRDTDLEPSADTRDARVDFDVPARLDRHGERATMLGVLRAHCRVDHDGSLAEVRLSGDLIAPAATLAAIEGALRGLPAARAPIVARVAPLLDGGEHFLLGAGAEDVSEAVVQAASR